MNKNTVVIGSLRELVDRYQAAEEFIVNGNLATSKAIGISYSLIFLDEMISKKKILRFKKGNVKNGKESR